MPSGTPSPTDTPASSPPTSPVSLKPQSTAQAAVQSVLAVCNETSSDELCEHVLDCVASIVSAPDVHKVQALAGSGALKAVKRIQREHEGSEVVAEKARECVRAITHAVIASREWARVSLIDRLID